MTHRRHNESGKTRVSDANWWERFFEVFDALVLHYASDVARLRTHIDGLERHIAAIYGTRKWRLLSRLGQLKAAVLRGIDPG